MTAIKSPCNNICTVDPISKLCIGCGRTLNEVGSWIRYTDDERAGIMAGLPQRLKLIRKARTKQVDST